MKRIILIVAMISIPLTIFADFQVGGAAYLKVAMTEDQIDEIDIKGLQASDFLFGLDTRLNLGIFQGQATAFLQPADEESSARINFYTDLGLLLDLWLVRIGAGIGPNVSMAITKGEGIDSTDKIGANMKVFAELMLGDLSIGLNFVVLIDSLENADDSLDDELKGHLGISVLYKLF